MRSAILACLSLLLLGSGPAWADSAEALRLVDAGRAAEQKGDLGRAADSYAAALKQGLPEALAPRVAARLCTVGITLKTERASVAQCEAALEHGGASGREHAAILSFMLADMALIFATAGFYEDSAALLAEFDRRYAGVDFPDLSYQRRRGDIARAELLRVRRKPAEALAVIARLTTGRELVFPSSTPPEEAEKVSMEILRIRLFVAHDLQDEPLLRDTVRWQGAIMENLKTPDSLDHAGGVLLCQAYIIALGQARDRETLEQMDLRTDGLLLFLERTLKASPGWPLLGPRTMPLVRLCAPAYFATLPLETYRTMEQQGLGLSALLAMLEDFDAGRFDEARGRFDYTVAGLRVLQQPGTDRLARRLELLGNLLLTNPGPRPRR